MFKNGKPILLEKPPGFSSKETWELHEISKKNNTYGMVALNRRYYSDFQHGLALLADYGPIRGAVLEVPESITKAKQQQELRELEYENYFIRNSIHAFDFLRHVMGEVKKIKSMGSLNSENENRGLSAGAVLEHEGNKFSIISTLWDVKPSFWRIKIIGESGYIEFSEKNRTVLVDQKQRPFYISEDPIDSNFRKGNYMQNLDFIRSVSANKLPPFPACLLEDAYFTMKFMENFRKMIP